MSLLVIAGGLGWFWRGLGWLWVVLGRCEWFRLVVDGFGLFRLVAMVLAGVVVDGFGWFWVVVG